MAYWRILKHQFEYPPLLNANVSHHISTNVLNCEEKSKIYVDATLRSENHYVISSVLHN